MASLQVIAHIEIETDTCCCVFLFVSFFFFALVLMDIQNVVVVTSIVLGGLTSP